MSYIGYVGNQKALVETEAGFMMYVDTSDTAITPHLYRQGRWEPHVTSYLQSQDLEDKVCVDVGANMGYYSLLFGHLGAKEVYGFEPITRLVDMCLDSSTFIAHTKFHFYNRGLSDAVRRDISFNEIEGNVGASRIDEDIGEDKIETIDLDSLDIPHIDFMKIDVEGHEPEALIGAKDTIHRSPNPRIIMEWNANYVDYDRLQTIWDLLDLEAKLIAREEHSNRTFLPFDPAIEGVEDLLLTKK